jgi:hypothetical protein
MERWVPFSPLDKFDVADAEWTPQTKFEPKSYAPSWTRFPSFGQRNELWKPGLGLDQISNKLSFPLPSPSRLDMVPSGWVWGFYFSIAIADWGGGFQTLETRAAGEKQWSGQLPLSPLLLAGIRHQIFQGSCLMPKSKEGCKKHLSLVCCSLNTTNRVWAQKLCSLANKIPVLWAAEWALKTRVGFGPNF